MPELLLHYIWQHGLFKVYEQCTADGCIVEVLDTGMYNTDSGPDFTNVRLRFLPKGSDSSKAIELVGNIEIHVKSSDWYNHQHHLDSAYNNILLHVVSEIDKEVFNSQGQPVRQLVLRYPRSKDYIERLLHDIGSMDKVAYTHKCAHFLTLDSNLLKDNWRDALLRKRFECKRASVEQLLKKVNNNWEEAFYISLAHYFGFHTNNVPFELLAMQTPLNCLLKHRDNLFQLRAILLGQSGLLCENNNSNKEESHEHTLLYKEYMFLRTKFGLTPLNKNLWKQNKIYPNGRPELRIEQFALLLYNSEFVFSRAMEANNVDTLRAIFGHGIMDSNTGYGGIGTASIDILIINAVLPFKYARGQVNNVIDILKSLPAENNRIIRNWKKLGQQVKSAADSQALLHLYQLCCQKEGCMNCDVAYQIFLSPIR